VTGLKAITQYEAVRNKVGEGMPVGQAIKEVAEEIGVKPSTVHTNYYRVLSETGRSVRYARSRGRKAVNGRQSTTELVKRAIDVLTVLAVHTERLERDATRLQEVENTLAHTS
jgi:hypothetical protein